jgi:hypothetical protein
MDIDEAESLELKEAPSVKLRKNILPIFIA